MRELLAAYGLERAPTRRLSVGEQHVYLVDQRWVLRVYPAERVTEVRGDAELLLFLEEQGYSAECVRRTVRGEPVARSESKVSLLTERVVGRATGFAPASLRTLGEALGRLHALPPAAAPARRAMMLPRREVAYALSRLASIEGDVPPPYRGVEEALRSLDLCEELPDVLIHNDCHPWNSRRRTDGSVVLVDWEGAGRGPAIVDLGFLLVSCEITAFGPNRLRPDPRRLEAIVAGYREHRQPSSAELDRLIHAVRFRSLISAAGALARSTGKPLDESPWWWRRYLASDEIADRAVQLFAA